MASKPATESTSPAPVETPPSIPVSSAIPSQTLEPPPVLPAGPQRGRPRLARCARGHVFRTANGGTIREGEPTPSECSECVSGRPARAKTRPRIPGIDTEDPQARVSRLAAESLARETFQREAAEREAARSKEALRAARAGYCKEVAFVDAILGPMIRLISTLELKQRYGIDISTMPIMAIYSSENPDEPFIAVETTVDKGLSHSISEVTAYYAKGVFTHPLIPAIATGGACAIAIVSSVAAQKRDGKPKTENGASKENASIKVEVQTPQADVS